jgi:hypothetical protein
MVALSLLGVDSRALLGVFIITAEGALGTTSAGLSKRRKSFRLQKRHRMTSYHTRNPTVLTVDYPELIDTTCG